MTINIENHDSLQTYLEQKRGFDGHEIKHMENLGGGVSNRIVKVDLTNNDSLVIKQALEKLRVPGEWHCHPSRILREIEGAKWLLASPESIDVPRVLFQDDDNYIYGMEAVASPFINLKQYFLEANIGAEQCEQAGRVLATIHKKGEKEKKDIPTLFYDRDFFESLRLDPFYVESSRALNDYQFFFDELIIETRSDLYTMVHGDFSPKNLLLKDGQLILLDHEVIHYGDGTFDLGFFIAHLMSKANLLHEKREKFIDGIASFFDSYNEIVNISVKREKRAVRHSIACFISRACGLSQIEYLDSSEKQRQVEIGKYLIDRLPENMNEMVQMSKSLFQNK